MTYQEKRLAEDGIRLAGMDCQDIPSRGAEMHTSGFEPGCPVSEFIALDLLEDASFCLHAIMVSRIGRFVSGEESIELKF